MWSGRARKRDRCNRQQSCPGTRRPGMEWPYRCTSCSPAALRDCHTCPAGTAAARRHGQRTWTADAFPQWSTHSMACILSAHPRLRNARRGSFCSLTPPCPVQMCQRCMRYRKTGPVPAGTCPQRSLRTALHRQSSAALSYRQSRNTCPSRRMCKQFACFPEQIDPEGTLGTKSAHTLPGTVPQSRVCTLLHH